MATIKALEGRTVHQIQSGQVIVDLCSVVKELVENSLDAGATSIEVRFKNNGLDSIEVQDTGIGISSDNYETVALKHFTSKLTNYDDLTSLQTFGFRGEALSSLCALSKLHIVTARADEAPKGTRLDFEISGKLKATSIVAAQKGTTVTVEDLFLNLPVRRRELEKNIKREYGKVLSLLQAYACISTEARISASNVMAKGKRAVVFASNSNSTTRENIANVFGTKALPMLVSVDLQFDMEPANTLDPYPKNTKVQILGHISKPVFGEGRNAPDRQMFFVNARPCSLPQVAKVFNEVYKSYNVSQSPFIFANIILDTNAYDVNVSPDKRTIMLHNQNLLLESLRTSLTDLFEKQDQTVPLTQKTVQKLPAFKQLPVRRESSKSESTEILERDPVQEAAYSSDADTEEVGHNDSISTCSNDQDSSRNVLPNLIDEFAGRHAKARVTKGVDERKSGNDSSHLSKEKQRLTKNLKVQQWHDSGLDDCDQSDSLTRLRVPEAENVRESALEPCERPNERRLGTEETLEESHVSPNQSAKPTQGPEGPASQGTEGPASQSTANPSHGVVPNAFERMRPRRRSPEVATITIGSKTTSEVLGGSIFKKRRVHSRSSSISSTNSQENESSCSYQEVSQRMQAFAAPGSGIAKVSDSHRGKTYALPPHSSGAEEGENEDVTNTRLASGNETEAASAGNGSSLVDKDEVDRQHSSPSSRDTEPDEDYVDEEEKRAREDIRVAELIRDAELTASVPTIDKKRRAHQILRGVGDKDPTTSLVQLMDTSIQCIGLQLQNLESTLRSTMPNTASQISPAGPIDAIAPEDRLTLTISKDDFVSMHIIGQFNLGFVLATRAGTDMFIIDQHASDEKYNFERLQRSTIVQNQRLVHPQRLELTAVDEEIILENNDVLHKNGFLVEMDQSGCEPVGQRCKLLSLPMSKEVTFDTSDLEELIALLADSPPTTTTITTTRSSSSSAHIPRPSKVRRMFAMRACRSSIMIGRTLTMRQMQGLVKHMGEIDKPWNCPHGRPTMRHLCSLGDWTEWKEGDGLGGLEEQADPIDWGRWVERVRASSSSNEDGTDDGDGDGIVERDADEEEGGGDTVERNVESGD